jgi:ATP-binding cassette subfamily G (WHITE) protein 2 (SNQ2)
MRHPDMRDIISGFEGTVRPGEMLRKLFTGNYVWTPVLTFTQTNITAVVLGRPGSGCSTLLKTLANQTEEYISVTGERHYDSLSPRDIREKYRGDVTYCPEEYVSFEH